MWVEAKGWRSGHIFGKNHGTDRVFGLGPIWDRRDRRQEVLRIDWMVQIIGTRST